MKSIVCDVTAPWIIGHASTEAEYWSNEYGWVEEGYDHFTEGERGTLRLPQGGVWVRDENAPQVTLGVTVGDRLTLTVYPTPARFSEPENLIERATGIPAKSQAQINAEDYERLLKIIAKLAHGDKDKANGSTP